MIACFVVENVHDNLIKDFLFTSCNLYLSLYMCFFDSEAPCIFLIFYYGSSFILQYVIFFSGVIEYLSVAFCICFISVINRFAVNCVHCILLYISAAKKKKKIIHALCMFDRHKINILPCISAHISKSSFA